MRTALAMMLLLSLSSFASDQNDADRIGAIFAGLESNNAPGGAVLISKAGRTVFQRGYGITGFRTLDKIDELTNFRLASVSKQFTAMAIMLLVHDGKLHYEDRLTDIFPDFPAYGKSITIRHLLNHTSGLQDYEDLMPASDSRLPVEQVQIQDGGVLDLLKGQSRTKFIPGSRWAYSNSGYVVLGLIVGKVSGKPFPDFLHERIFVPLEMTSTIAYVSGSDTVPNRAFGHSLQGG